jgi:hypothetical protein
MQDKIQDKIGPCPFTEEEMTEFHENITQVALRLKERHDQYLASRSTNSNILSESSQEIHKTGTM